MYVCNLKRMRLAWNQYKKVRLERGKEGECWAPKFWLHASHPVYLASECKVWISFSATHASWRSPTQHTLRTQRKNR